MSDSLAKPEGSGVWDERTTGEFTTLWMDGISVIQIGRRLGFSKNAIAGKRKRLGLPERGSPIVRRPGDHEILTLQEAPLPVATTQLPVLRMAPLPVIQPLAPSFQAPSEPKPAVNSHLTCCWPLGEPGKPSFRFCDEPAKLGKPYCDAHCGKAYIHTPRARQERLLDFYAKIR